MRLFVAHLEPVLPLVTIPRAGIDRHERQRAQRLLRPARQRKCAASEWLHSEVMGHDGREVGSCECAAREGAEAESESAFPVDPSAKQSDTATTTRTLTHTRHTERHRRSPIQHVPIRPSPMMAPPLPLLARTFCSHC